MKWIYAIFYPDAKQAVDILRSLNIKVVMLTGDNEFVGFIDNLKSESLL
jgi:hypothetical protein